MTELQYAMMVADGHALEFISSVLVSSRSEIVWVALDAPHKVGRVPSNDVNFLAYCWPLELRIHWTVGHMY